MSCWVENIVLFLFVLASMGFVSVLSHGVNFMTGSSLRSNIAGSLKCRHA